MELPFLLLCLGSSVIVFIPEEDFRGKGFFYVGVACGFYFLGYIVGLARADIDFYFPKKISTFFLER